MKDAAQDDQQAVGRRTGEDGGVINAVQSADRLRLVNRDQFPVNPGRYLLGQVSLEQADQSHARQHIRIERAGSSRCQAE